MSGNLIKGNTGDFFISSPSQGEDQGGGYIIYEHHPRNQKLIKNSRQLRKHMTDVERKLWRHLRREQLGVKFRRQYPIANYIVDLVCLEKFLIIELDGSQHAVQQVQDIKRDGVLQAKGFTILRFWNNEVMENIEGVLHAIAGRVTPALTLPLKRGGNKKIDLPQREKGYMEEP